MICFFKEMRSVKTDVTNKLMVSPLCVDGRRFQKVTIAAALSFITLSVSSLKDTWKPTQVRGEARERTRGFSGQGHTETLLRNGAK